MFVDKTGLPEAMLDRLNRLAAFQNPEFYKAQSMRLPTFDKPRVICCAEEFSQFLAVPRGLLEEVLLVLRQHRIEPELQDERYSGHRPCRSWIFPRDPDFVVKAGRVRDLHARRWQRRALKDDEFAISADEKTSIQARRRKHATRTCRPRTPLHVEHEYFRCGAWTFIAGLQSTAPESLAAVNRRMALPLLTGSSSKS